MGGGLLMTKYYSDQITGKSLFGGGVTYIRAIVDFKYVQAGIGIDFYLPGKPVDLEAPTKYGTWGSTYVDVQGVAYTLILNGKINIQKGNYIYGGIATGVNVIPTSPIIGDMGNTTDELKLINGLQVGYALRLGKRLLFDISESWRVQKLTGIGYDDPDRGPYADFHDVLAHSFTTTIGIKISKR